jgi:hypothetical protein
MTDYELELAVIDSLRRVRAAHPDKSFDEIKELHTRDLKKYEDLIAAAAVGANASRGGH